MTYFFRLAVFALILLPSITLANVRQGFEWHLADSQPKRLIHVCFHRSLNEEWRGWAQEAVDKWNAHSSETGWSFEVVPFTRDTCQVFIVLSDIPEAENGGARFDPLDVMEGQNEQPDGRANGVIITVDSNLERTKEWISEEEDVADASHDGWSTTEGEGTRDPIDTIMHELGHALRLDHHDDYDANNPDGDISDPKQPGEHYHELSEADIRQAHEASTAEFVMERGSVSPEGARNFQLGRATLDIPQHAFGYWYRDYEVMFQEATDQIPTPLNVPEGYSHVFDAFGFFTDGVVQYEVGAIIPYDESLLDPAAIPLDTAEGFFPPGLQEQTIAVVRFEKAPWDLTPAVVEENPSGWTLIEGVELDTEANTISFLIDEPGYYGLVATADDAEPPVTQGYTRVLDGNVIGEDKLKQALFWSDLKDHFVGQLPAFLVGFAVGVVIMSLWCRRGRKGQSQAHSKHSETQERYHV